MVPRLILMAGDAETDPALGRISGKGVGIGSRGNGIGHALIQAHDHERLAIDMVNPALDGPTVDTMAATSE